MTWAVLLLLALIAFELNKLRLFLQESLRQIQATLQWQSRIVEEMRNSLSIHHDWLRYSSALRRDRTEDAPEAETTEP